MLDEDTGESPRPTTYVESGLVGSEYYGIGEQHGQGESSSGP